MYAKKRRRMKSRIRRSKNKIKKKRKKKERKMRRKKGKEKKKKRKVEAEKNHTKYMFTNLQLTPQRIGSKRKVTTLDLTWLKCATQSRVYIYKHKQ